MSESAALPEPTEPAAAELPPPPQDTARESAPDIPALVAEALREGPATSFEIARRVDAASPHAIGSREGYLVALLLEMRRAGRVDARWVDRPGGRRRLHGAPGAAWPAGTIAPDRAISAPRIAPSPAARRAVDAATSKLSFAPRLAEEARAELLAHLGDLTDVRLREGLDRATAEEEAIHALGDPWKIATDLSRAARGRRTVIFARSSGESFLSLLIYDAGILVAILATIVFLRDQVIAAYHIPTKSMEPTLHGDRRGGDRILVLRHAPAPGRFDIEVFEGWTHDRKQYVKRCVGLPGETVGIHAGDLWIDGRLVRKDGTDLEAMMFPVFDRDREIASAGADQSEYDARVQETWTQEPAESWALVRRPDGEHFRGRATPEAPAVLRFHDRLSDGTFDEETAEFDAGSNDVADGRATFDVTPSPGARFLVRWRRGKEEFDAILGSEQAGVALAIDGNEVARRPDVEVPPGRATRVRFSHVDRVLRLDVDGKLALKEELPEPSPPTRTGPGAQISVRVLDGTLRIRPVRVERDVHWTSEYETGPRAPLGPDHFFMLGDNSSNSQDSRTRGPVHRDRLVGRPLLVVWPLSRFRIPR